MLIEQQQKNYKKFLLKQFKTDKEKLENFNNLPTAERIDKIYNYIQKYEHSDIFFKFLYKVAECFVFDVEISSNNSDNNCNSKNKDCISSSMYLLDKFFDTPTNNINLNISNTNTNNLNINNTNTNNFNTNNLNVNTSTTNINNLNTTNTNLNNNLNENLKKNLSTIRISILETLLKNITSSFNRKLKQSYKHLKSQIDEENNLTMSIKNLKNVTGVQIVDFENSENVNLNINNLNNNTNNFNNTENIKKLMKYENIIINVVKSLNNIEYGEKMSDLEFDYVRIGLRFVEFTFINTFKNYKKNFNLNTKNNKNTISNLNISSNTINNTISNLNIINSKNENELLISFFKNIKNLKFLDKIEKLKQNNINNNTTNTNINNTNNLDDFEIIYPNVERLKIFLGINISLDVFSIFNCEKVFVFEILPAFYLRKELFSDIFNSDINSNTTNNNLNSNLNVNKIIQIIKNFNLKDQILSIKYFSTFLENLDINNLNNYNNTNNINNLNNYNNTNNINSNYTNYNINDYLEDESTFSIYSINPDSLQYDLFIILSNYFINNNLNTTTNNLNLNIKNYFYFIKLLKNHIKTLEIDTTKLDHNIPLNIKYILSLYILYITEFKIKGTSISNNNTTNNTNINTNNSSSNIIISNNLFYDLQQKYYNCYFVFESCKLKNEYSEFFNYILKTSCIKCICNLNEIDNNKNITNKNNITNNTNTTNTNFDNNKNNKKINKKSLKLEIMKNTKNKNLNTNSNIINNTNTNNSNNLNLNIVNKKSNIVVLFKRIIELNCFYLVPNFVYRVSVLYPTDISFKEFNLNYFLKKFNFFIYSHNLNINNTNNINLNTNLNLSNLDLNNICTFTKTFKDSAHFHFTKTPIPTTLLTLLYNKRSYDSFLFIISLIFRFQISLRKCEEILSFLRVLEFENFKDVVGFVHEDLRCSFVNDFYGEYFGTTNTNNNTTTNNNNKNYYNYNFGKTSKRGNSNFFNERIFLENFNFVEFEKSILLNLYDNSSNSNTTNTTNTNNTTTTNIKYLSNDSLNFLKNYILNLLKLSLNTADSVHISIVKILFLTLNKQLAQFNEIHRAFGLFFKKHFTRKGENIFLVNNLSSNNINSNNTSNLSNSHVRVGRNILEFYFIVYFPLIDSIKSEEIKQKIIRKYHEIELFNFLLKNKIKNKKNSKKNKNKKLEVIENLQLARNNILILSNNKNTNKNNTNTTNNKDYMVFEFIDLNFLTNNKTIQNFLFKEYSEIEYKFFKSKNNKKFIYILTIILKLYVDFDLKGYSVLVGFFNLECCGSRLSDRFCFCREQKNLDIINNSNNKNLEKNVISSSKLNLEDINNLNNNNISINNNININNSSNIKNLNIKNFIFHKKINILLNTKTEDPTLEHFIKSSLTILTHKFLQNKIDFNSNLKIFNDIADNLGNNNLNSSKNNLNNKNSNFNIRKIVINKFYPLFRNTILKKPNIDELFLTNTNTTNKNSNNTNDIIIEKENYLNSTLYQKNDKITLKNYSAKQFTNSLHLLSYEIPICIESLEPVKTPFLKPCVYLNDIYRNFNYFSALKLLDLEFFIPQILSNISGGGSSNNTSNFSSNNTSNNNTNTTTNKSNNNFECVKKIINKSILMTNDEHYLGFIISLVWALRGYGGECLEDKFYFSEEFKKNLENLENKKNFIEILKILPYKDYNNLNINSTNINNNEKYSILLSTVIKGIDPKVREIVNNTNIFSNFFAVMSLKCIELKNNQQININNTNTTTNNNTNNNLNNSNSNIKIFLNSNMEILKIFIKYHKCYINDFIKDISDFRIMTSAAKAPIGVTLHYHTDNLKNLNNLKNNTKNILKKKFIFKAGDDCRQDMLALQIIKFFSKISEFHNIKMNLFSFSVKATGFGSGIIEMIENTVSRDQIGHRLYEDINYFYLKNYGQRYQKKFYNGITNFIKSFAGYSLFCYFLNVKDRHNANILYDYSGNIIHIDFGFMFDISPGGINFEIPIKISTEIYNLLTNFGTSNDGFDAFLSNFIDGFLIIRMYEDEIVSIINRMKGEIPCLKKNSIKNLKIRFLNNYSDENAVAEIVKFVNKSVKSKRTLGYDFFQFITNNISH